MKSIGNITYFSNRTLTVVPYLENKRNRLFCSRKTPIVSDRNNCCLLLFFQLRALTTNVDIISFGNEIDYFALEDFHSF